MVAKKPLSAEAKIFLVPTDFSSCASEAAEQALLLAGSFSARIFFFTLSTCLLPIPSPMLMNWGSVPVAPLLPEDIEPEWEDFLCNLPLDRVDWEKSAEEGQAAAAIVHQAERVKADLIVMGTHGRSGLPSMLLGSVAEKVARTASCAVLSVRQEAFQFERP